MVPISVCLFGMTILKGETTESVEEPLLCGVFPPGATSLRGEASLGSPSPMGETGLSREAVKSVSTFLGSVSVCSWDGWPNLCWSQRQRGRVGAGDPAQPSLSPGTAMWGMSRPDWPGHPWLQEAAHVTRERGERRG